MLSVTPLSFRVRAFVLLCRTKRHSLPLCQPGRLAGLLRVYPGGAIVICSNVIQAIASRLSEIFVQHVCQGVSVCVCLIVRPYSKFADHASERPAQEMDDAF